MTRMRAFRRSSRDLLKEDTLASISRMIGSSDWKGLRELFGENGKRIRGLKTSSPLFPEDGSGGGGVFHALCRNHPPMDIVQILADAFPETLLQTDSEGRCPIHVAAISAASPALFKFLTETQPTSAGSQDVNGKTPLHLVCEHYPVNYNPEREWGRPLKESMLEVVKSLCKSSSSSVNLEDVNDMTAVEYAIDSGADLKVVKFLQKSCEKDWRNRRVNGEKHESVRKCLLVETQEHIERLQNDIVEMTKETAAVSLSTKETPAPSKRRSGFFAPRKRSSFARGA